MKKKEKIKIDDGERKKKMLLRKKWILDIPSL